MNESGDEYNDDPLNPLVEALFDEIEGLRMQVSKLDLIYVQNQKQLNDVDIAHRVGDALCHN